VPFEEVSDALRPRFERWAEQYEEVHQVAHWDDKQRRKSKDYDAAFEDAAQDAEKLLIEAATELMPPLLESYAAVIWEDQDECLEVRPEDVVL
jgi:hypothetical protein